MNNDNFKVFCSKKNLLVVIELIIMFVIMSAILWKYIDIFFSILLVIIFSLISVLMILKQFLFMVDVDKKTIKVRTGLGRKYEFSISDINKVECRRTDNIRNGTHLHIVLITQTEQLIMEGRFTGFDQMAGFLLDKLESGEINEKAISDRCQIDLLGYKNNKHRK